MQESGTPERQFLTPTSERIRRHVAVHGLQAVLGGISASAVVAGFVSAAGNDVPLLGAILLALAAAVVSLLVTALPDWQRRRMSLIRRRPVGPQPGRPPQLELIGVRPSAPVRQMAALRCDDPVYGGGLRALLPPSHPLVVIPSNARDVGRPHELPLPLFAQGRHRTRVDVDLAPFGIPIAPYSFERELPEGVQDIDHTLAVKDLVFVPELVALLQDGDPLARAPMMLPEHCVDPAQLAERDVIVVGGPDTNFWHGALFEPVARAFASPPSSVPLALDLREDRGDLPSYGSRSLSVVLAGVSSVLRHTREDRAQLDERLYPTYGMLLACRNPFAAAVGRSHWCVFAAGTRSLGTSGTVLALAMALAAMKADPEVNFFSEVPTQSPDVRAPVSALLCRTVRVERAVLRRDGALTDRGLHRLPTDGIDPAYSDSYVPVEVEYLSYAERQPRWSTLGRLSAPQ
jgi:hypothetical protein